MIEGAEWLIPYRPYLSAISGIMIVAGNILFTWSLRFRTRDQPLGALFKPKHWWPMMIRA
ncbi:MAG: hypothetical protein Kow0074_17690 [Candidatus Zixiibacteriota bacterium]